MSNLKELTWEHHKDAERQEFVKVLMSGNIHPKFYATFLWNQHMKYDLLEALVSVTGLLIDIPGIWRKQSIYDDFVELWSYEEQPVILESTKKYVEHMRTIIADPDALMAHVYVMHMGDLSGGQMIAKKVPGAGRLYQFEGDISQIKEQIRSKTHDGMADEARKCFSFATETFKELMELEGIEHYMEQVDSL
jgi:heme oxygenase